MSERAVDVDVSHLPSLEFGPRSLLWWGTIGFMVIEGFTLLLAAASYLYLRINQYSWPPSPTPPPDLLFPTINVVLLLLLMVPMHGVGKAAKRFDKRGVVKGLVITTGLSVFAVGLRGLELASLNVRWDTNAYGSAAWAVVIAHGTLIAFDLIETASLTVLFYIGHAQRKHYSDAADAALYQYFLSLSWIPLYLIIYWGPRVI
jgi:heme/copper-type cytochrome/quinol oxidase subunit 3